MKRAIALILLASLLAASISCGEAKPSERTPTTSDTAETTPAETEMSYDPGLPAADFKGETFTFLTRGEEGTSNNWYHADIVSESENGEYLNDAVWRRTSYIEDTYNVKIEQLYGGNTSTALTGSEMSRFVNSSIMSGDNAFDAILSSAYDTIGYAVNDYLLDLNELEYLDLTKPWWDQNAAADLAFGDRIYFTVGELTYVDNLAAQCMIFSKNVADTLKIADPYQTVRDGDWTLDTLIANSKLAFRDINGDNEMDESDCFGFTYWQDTCFSFVISTGNTIGSIDKNGEPQFTFYSERMVNTWEKMIAFLEDESTLSLFNERKLYTGEPYGGTVVKMLDSDSMLYNWVTMCDLSALRNSTNDFGILPIPKYDADQENYITPVGGYGCAMLSVPVTTGDPDRTGFILEAFCAKSMELVTPAFYDKTLSSKYTRDVESEEMLDLIYSTRRYDIGYFSLWGDITNQLMSMWNKKDANLTSMYESVKEKALSDLAATAEAFSK
ncbi:MAG: hypothetical protein IJ493_12310 [Clostridia bacterium]|nr:hypothetical protein [Clostridia bacterium]